VGQGRYDPTADELVVQSSPAPPADRAPQDTWITGDQKLTIAGLKAPATARLEAVVKTDVSSISHWLAPADRRLSGQLDAVFRAQPDRDSWNLGVRAELTGLAQVARDGSRAALDGDVVLAVTGRYALKPDRLELTELALKAPYVDVQGAGVVRALAGQPEVDLKGSLNPDWEALSRLLAAKVEPNARIEGRPRAWRIAGRVSDMPAIDQLGALEGEFGIQIDALDVFGMRLKKSPIVVRAVSGRLEIDPMETTLNGGLLHVEPELVKDKSGSTWLRLGPSTRLDAAVVNDEVSHRVLSYVAPVLDGATRVEGRVSMRLAEAMFPIMAGPDAQPRIEGDVLFDEVRFMPGPLADELLSVFQRDRKPLAVLRDPVAVRIAGRKIYQQGLSIPVANLASIGVDGSVDFDRKLDLVAHFGLVPPRNGIPVLTPIMGAARFDLPIGGTLDKPKINGDALKEYWKSVGLDLLGNSLNLGTGALDRLLQVLPGRRMSGQPPRDSRGGVPRESRRGPPPPPRPGASDPRTADAPGDDGVSETRHETLKPPPPAADPPAARPGALTPEERRQRREEKKRERLEKKAARRAGATPE
jgi:translocation and assembly module TamB